MSTGTLLYQNVPNICGTVQAETQAATMSTEQPVAVQPVKRVKLNTFGVGKVRASCRRKSAECGVVLFGVFQAATV